MHVQLQRIAIAALVADTAYAQSSGICTFTEYLGRCDTTVTAAAPLDYLQTCGGVTFDGNGTFPTGPRGGAGGPSSGPSGASAGPSEENSSSSLHKANLGSNKRRSFHLGSSRNWYNYPCWAIIQHLVGCRRGLWISDRLFCSPIKLNSSVSAFA